MRIFHLCCFCAFALLCSSCAVGAVVVETNKPFQGIKNITYNAVSVDVVIDKPAADTVDVILAYHGTVSFDNKIVEAAQTTLSRVRAITTAANTMIVSVAYPEEGLLMGDNVRESEAALLWVKNRAAKEMNLHIKKIFLVGHSQGGYIVTRLNTMHATDGVVANAPGPLNLTLRCQLEETGQGPASGVCALMRRRYGTTTTNADAYHARSLLNFTTGFTSPILFVQGLDDAPIQLMSWSNFQQRVENCSDCSAREFLNLAGFGHTALFDSPEARSRYNQFLRR